MTALPLRIADPGPGRSTPVSHRAAEPRRNGGRQTVGHDTLGGRLAPAYVVYDSGRLVGTIIAPAERPVFGRAAPTVLLRRET